MASSFRGDTGLIEPSFAWAIRFWRLVKDYERRAAPLADLHLVAFACFILEKAALLVPKSRQPSGVKIATMAAVMDQKLESDGLA